MSHGRSSPSFETMKGRERSDPGQSPAGSAHTATSGTTIAANTRAGDPTEFAARSRIASNLLRQDRTFLTSAIREGRRSSPANMLRRARVWNRTMNDPFRKTNLQSRSETHA